MSWDVAYSNTGYRKTTSPYTGVTSYHAQCRDCGQETNFKPTRERQMLGNVIQRIVICECGNPFIEDWT